MSSSIPSWQILTAHAQPFRGARDLAFCLKVPLDSLLVWASSEGSGETARIVAWTFAARIGYKYQISLTRSTWLLIFYQSHEVPAQNVKNDDYDSAGNYIGGANSDIFKRINAMLDNTLDLANIAPLTTEQNSRKYGKQCP